VALFILNRDLQKAHDVEIVWEDQAPTRVLTTSLLTGDDLKAVNSFQSPQRVAPQAFAKPSTANGRSKFEVPAHSYTMIQWSL
jgi:alpha-L-arabinofuranosidase